MAMAGADSESHMARTGRPRGDVEAKSAEMETGSYAETGICW
jgi:hypothetical protein